MQKLAKISAGSMVILAVFAVLLTPLASATTIEAYRVIGRGVAVDQPEGDLHRSKIGFIAVVESKEGDSIHFKIRRGLLVINDMGSPIRHRMIADTWHGMAHNDGKKFNAEGKVSDAEGNNYNVQMKGEYIRETSRGRLMIIDASLSGNGEHYDMTYLALLKKVVFERPDIVSSSA